RPWRPCADRGRHRDRPSHERSAGRSVQMIATVADRWRPKAFAAWALGAGTFWGLACVPIAMVFSTVSAYRLSQTVHVDDIVFGPTRSAIVDTLLLAIGVERTAVLVYVLQRSFDALVVAAAVPPIV